ncbi:glycoside hydrolase family 43 protein [Cadophora sp. DSE1049]|nr:glycoside hydrolase family 43 protein [Cadophora sp. DSE1049]
MRLVLAFAIALWTSAALAVKVTYTNKHYYHFDVDGNAIDSTNGKVEWVKDQYFWIAEPDSCGADVCDKISYSSPDLTNWYYNGPLFNLTTNMNVCSGFGSCSRPKVVYNEKTKKYVLYGFASVTGATPNIPVFTSDQLTKGYTFAGRMIPDYHPSGYGVEDLGLAVIDGKGYVTWTGFNLTAALTQPLVEAGGDFPVTPASKNLVDGLVESPDLFKRGDYYYMVGSGTCAFCTGTTTLAYRSKSPFGPWKRQIVDNNNTCGGQAMGVMTVPSSSTSIQGNSYVYHADAFHTAPVGQHFTLPKGHGFWPLSFNHDGSIQRIDCSPTTKFIIDAPPATAKVPSTGRATTAADGSGNYGDYWPETGLLTQRYLYQTWTSSTSRNLTEIRVNLACNSPVSNRIAITVFSFRDENELISPFFKWNVLGSLTFGQDSSSLLPGFKVKRVPVNKAVKAGDKLGIALAFPGPLVPTNSLPYAYLLQDTTGTRTNHKLYELKRGHVSRDGLTASQSPVKEVEGRELKWYATVG